MIEVNAANAGKGKSAFDAGIKAINAGDTAGAMARFQEAGWRPIRSLPRLGRIWPLFMPLKLIWRKARDAFTHAVEENPKALGPRVVLTRYAIRGREVGRGIQAGCSGCAFGQRSSLPGALPAPSGRRIPFEAILRQRKVMPNKRSTRRISVPCLARSTFWAAFSKRRATQRGRSSVCHITWNWCPMHEDAAQIKAHIDGMGTPGAAEPTLEIITH